MRDLEDMGAVLLTPSTRTIGFERRPVRRTTQPRQVSPGSGGPVDRFDDLLWRMDDRR